jgi:cobalt-zinc-cadmium efflux system outer membrane protein
VSNVARRHALITIAISLVIPTAGPASGAGEATGLPSARVTLVEALARARASNPELRATAQDLELARGGLVKARYPSQFNPEIGGEAAQRERNEPGESGAVTDFAVTLSQEFEVAGQRGARIREAERNLGRAEAQLRDRERLLDGDVKQAFVGVLVSTRRLELLRAIEELDRRVRDAAVARTEAGEASAIEANLAAIRYGQARKDAFTAEADRLVALIGLRRLLNLDPDAPLDPLGDIRARPVDVTPADALARALDTRPDLLAARREVERVDAERALTRRLALPNPTVVAFYREEERGPDKVAGAGLRIPLPLFDRKQGELVALAARHNQAALQHDAVRRQVEQEVADALQRYDAARRTLTVFEQDVLARVDENFRFIETAYRAGKIDLFQVVVVQNDLVAAQLSYLDVLARFRQAEIDLERAMGGAL